MSHTIDVSNNLSVLTDAEVKRIAPVISSLSQGDQIRVLLEARALDIAIKRKIAMDRDGADTRTQLLG